MFSFPVFLPPRKELVARSFCVGGIRSSAPTENCGPFRTRTLHNAPRHSEIHRHDSGRSSVSTLAATQNSLRAWQFEFFQRTKRLESRISSDPPRNIPVDGQGLATKYLGVPTGSPISTTLFNVYLDPVDQLFSDPGEGFYARYADDIIFAHPDPSVVQQATRRLDLALFELGLSANQEKGRDLFVDGRRPDSACERGGGPAVIFGCAIKFDATVSLGQAKVRNLFSDLKSRICGHLTRIISVD